MNAERRKQLQKADNLLTELQGIVQDVLDAEIEARDNTPGAPQEKFDDSIAALEELINLLEAADCTITDAFGDVA